MVRLEPIGRTLIAGGSVPLPDYWGGMNDLAQVAPLPPPSLYMYLYMYRVSQKKRSLRIFTPLGATDASGDNSVGQGCWGDVG